jgi:uncharacterized Ntn-hydrolase superfamily protein
LAANRSLAEKKTVCHAAKQALQNSNDAKARLTQELESTKASLTATHDKLTSKSAALDIVVIQEQQAKIQMKMAEEKLKAAEEKLKIQEQSLDLARQTLSKQELDAEILRKDFTIDDMEREVVANSAYDAAHKFVSLYDFSSLTESDDNNSPETL